MRRKYINKFMVYIVFHSIFAFIALFALMFFGPNPRLSNYFILDEVYVNLTGTVESFILYDNSMYMYIHHNNDDFDNYFVISDINYQIVKANGFVEDLDAYSEIEFISAPGYFWDSWDYPIVEVRMNNKLYLEYHQGKDNLVEHYLKSRKSFVIFLGITIPILSFTGFFTLFYLIKYIREKEQLI